MFVFVLSFVVFRKKLASFSLYTPWYLFIHFIVLSSFYIMFGCHWHHHKWLEFRLLKSVNSFETEDTESELEIELIVRPFKPRLLPNVIDRGKAQVQFSSTLVYYFQSGCFGHWSSDDRGDRVRNRGRWQRMAGVWIKECESQRYTEMFRSCGTTIQLSADEITRPGSLRCSFSDQRVRSGVGVSLQVTACPVKRSLRGQLLALVVASNLLCTATARIKVVLNLYSVVISNLLLCVSANSSRLWALGSP